MIPEHSTILVQVETPRTLKKMPLLVAPSASKRLVTFRLFDFPEHEIEVDAAELIAAINRATGETVHA